MNNRFFIPHLHGWLIVGLCSILLLSGCDTNGGSETLETIPVSYSFQHRVGDDALHTDGGGDLAFNEMRFTNAAGNRYAITRLEYIVTDLALVAADGSQVELAAAHYVNPTQPATLQGSEVEVPKDTYVGIRFTFGIAGEENVFGALPNTADFDAMLWPAAMGGGTDRYHYMRLEGNYEAEDGTHGFLAHTGPTAGNDYSFTQEITFDGVLNDPDAIILHLSMDVNAWFGATVVYDLREFEGGIMGNPEAQERLRANAPSVYTVNASYAIPD